MLLIIAECQSGGITALLRIAAKLESEGEQATRRGKWSATQMSGILGQHQPLMRT